MKSPPTPTHDVPNPPTRPATAHKGHAGRVAIVAGSRGMSGAAVLSAQGALRAGAGLVRVHCPASILPVIAAGEPCLMTVPLSEDYAGRIAAAAGHDHIDLDWCDVLAIGPGLGQSHDLPAYIVNLAAAFDGPVLVDADGLNNLAIADNAKTLWQQRAGRPTIITPHPGEMARLCNAAGLDLSHEQDDDTRLQVAHAYSDHANVTVVLKGHHTVVATPDQTFVNTTGNPGMATGGMGDVLTGLIAALLGQGLNAFDACRLGVHLHGLAGDFCAREIGPIGYLPRDLADRVPRAMQKSAQPRMGFK